MPDLRRKLPSSHALFVFDAAARNGSFTAAAAELNVTQPAVSRMLGQFEDYLGVRLFDRTNGRAALTEDGEILYRRVSDGFRSIEGGLIEIDRRRKGTETVTLSVSSAFTTHWLMPRIDKLQRQFPTVDLRFQLDFRAAARAGRQCRSRHAVSRSIRSGAERRAGHEGSHAADLQPGLSRRRSCRRADRMPTPSSGWPIRPTTGRRNIRRFSPNGRAPQVAEFFRLCGGGAGRAARPGHCARLAHGRLALAPDRRAGSGLGSAHHDPAGFANWSTRMTDRCGPSSARSATGSSSRCTTTWPPSTGFTRACG